MYLSHYNLLKKPFQLTTDPRFLWLGEKHKEALATLKYGVVDQKGFLLVTGDVGTGKTTLINALLESLEDDTYVANISNPWLNLIDFFNFIAISFNIPKKFDNKVDFLVHFSRFLKKAYSENKNVLLIIDEAHSLSKELLENIRLLSNIELPEEKLINIFFVGQNEINQTLASQECRALRQRIMLTYQIKPLSEIETFEYIKCRLKVAGTEVKLFSRKAIQEIYDFSHGYPRLINTICDHALLTGYARDLKKIPPDVIKECAQELSLPGETPKNIRSSLSGQHYSEGVSHFVREPFGNEIGMAMGDPKEVKTPAAAFSQTKNGKKSKKLEEEVKGNGAKVSRKFAAIPRLKRPFLWGSAVTVAVIFILLTVLSNKVISSKRDRQKPSTPVIAAPSSPSSETGNHFISSTFLDRGKTATGNPIEDTTGSESKTSKLTELALAKKELNNKNYVRAVASFEDIIARNPSNMTEVKAYYSQALRGQAGKHMGKRPNKAEILLQKALEADPQNAQAHFDLGKLYTRSKDYAKAIKSYQKAAALNYRTSDAFFNLGFIYAAKEDYINAEKMFLLVEESRPKYLDKALFNLAVVLQKQGRKKQCIENLEKALMVNPKNQRVRTYLNHIKSN
ncbi:MAG: AAA family ATPase [Desulfobacterales bacterium]|nr:AAA family ATPase [Desulfobacterales bacterium]